jgi:hypothetical protein
MAKGVKKGVKTLKASRVADKTEKPDAEPSSNPGSANQNE